MKLALSPHKSPINLHQSFKIYHSSRIPQAEFINPLWPFQLIPNDPKAPPPPNIHDCSACVCGVHNLHILLSTPIIPHHPGDSQFTFALENSSSTTLLLYYFHPTVDCFLMDFLQVTHVVGCLLATHFWLIYSAAQWERCSRTLWWG